MNNLDLMLCCVMLRDHSKVNLRRQSSVEWWEPDSVIIGIDFIGHEGTPPDSLTDQARNGLCAHNTVCKGIFYEKE